MSLSDFVSLGKLGDGAYSTVLKVRRKRDGKIYALKEVSVVKLTPKERANALNEVRLLASLRHPNIISYKEAFVDEGIIIEYADEGDLYQRILQRKGQYMSEDFVWSVLIQATRGLDALHRLNIMHRDLKSANIFLFSNGDVKLGDFNVSKVAKHGLLYTQTGTPYFASPEVWKEHPYSQKSDIWSLGCVLYETAALKPPFQAQDMEGLYHKVVQGQFSPLPLQFSQELQDVIAAMIKVDPALRPSCDEILRLPSVHQRLAYNRDDGYRSELLETIYPTDNFLELVGKLPRARYAEEERGRRPGLPKLQSQVASIRSMRQRESPSPYQLSIVRKARIEEADFDRSSSRLQKQVLRDNYGALQPLRRQRTGKGLLEEHSAEPTRNQELNDRCDQILESYQRSRVVMDLLKSPVPRRRAYPQGYGS